MAETSLSKSSLRNLHERHRRKILMVTTGVTSLGLLLLVVAISTNQWMLWTPASPRRLNSTGNYLVKSYRGLWKTCTLVYMNQSVSVPQYADLCTTRPLLFDDNHKKDHSTTNDKKSKHLDPSAADFTRTEAAFAVIGLVLSIISHLFALYTFKESRYMFKRLAGALYLLAAVCMLVCVEVLSNHVAEAAYYSSSQYQADHSYGYSLVFTWISLVFHAAAGITFLIMGRKHKLDHLHTDRTDQNPEDEPVVLGRI